MMIWAGCRCDGDRYKAEIGDNRGIPWDVTTQLFSWETSVIFCHLLSLSLFLVSLEWSLRETKQLAKIAQSRRSRCWTLYLVLFWPLLSLS